jgi:glycerophosphoryl diester phosphodiesterase
MSRFDLSWLCRTPIAHRGLHDAKAGIVENSLSAFRAAIASGYAIELDLQPSRDGEAMVFHDETLERLTEAQGRVNAHDAGALRALRLRGTGDTIPTLKEVLDLVAGKVPLLIEIKAWTRRVGLLEARAATHLRDYRGPVAVQSFNPLSLRWYRHNVPVIPRGLLSTDYRAATPCALTRRERFALRHLLAAPVIRPHFIAYDVRALPALAPRIARALGLPLIAWTVASDEERRIGARYADNIIFEGFRAPLLEGA